MAAGEVAIRQGTQTELVHKPFAAFLVRMTLSMRNGERYRPFVAPVRALVKPVSEGLFAGALDRFKVSILRNRPMFRLSVLFGLVGRRLPRLVRHSFLG